MCYAHRVKKHYIIIVVALLAFLAGRPALADVDIEYIGHASFVIESPNGVRIVIDPFNSNRWLGFRYPESVGKPADAVLVTHPHYDHDASL